MSARMRVFVIAVGVLLLLDLARSLYVRVGYSAPTEIWHPDPKQYADIVWPPASTVPAGAPLGERVYLANCAICHGPDGRGNGAAAPSMIPRPRDFTAGLYKYKSTAAGAPASEADLLRVVRDGLQASGMPYWRDVLSTEEIGAVVKYIRRFAPVSGKADAAPIAIAARVPPGPESAARGAALYARLGCTGCHGENLRGGLELRDAKGYPVISRDLTAPWTFRGGAEPGQIWLRLTTGLAPGPMPSYAASTTPQERWDLVNYLSTRQRAAPWQAGGKFEGPGFAANPELRGRYLVHAEMCGLCHTEVNPRGIYREDHYLAGGMRVGAYPQGIFISRNLTPDDATGLGQWTPQEIANAIRLGRAKGRTLNFWGMPWMYLHALTDADALAIARYLKTLPAVRNAVPEPLQYGVIETIYGKLRAGKMPVAPPRVLTYREGSYANPRGIAPGTVEAWLAGAQWLVLGLGLIAFVFARPRGSRLPRSVLGWSGTILGTVALVVLFAAGWFVYRTPALAFLPPDRIAEGAAGSIPRPDLSKLDPQRAALVARGRYLFNVASCAYCHGNDGSGGAKLSGGLGTIFTPNISSHPEAGIGAWSDAQIERAIRSGVSRNGRPLYWQGMPWDHFSNWDDEDVRSLVTYLRMLPPVAEKVPPYRPPAPDDCKVYTFWITPNRQPGCR